MIHAYLLRLLTKAFGEPLRSNAECDWWEIDRGDRENLRICLNARTLDGFAHILLFDPAQPEDQREADLVAASEAEADVILTRIILLAGDDSSPPSLAR